MFLSCTGLIIDAFGELRKKDDMVNEELKVRKVLE